jgi:hypothetical protein
MAPREFLSRAELAQRWGVTSKTVDRLRKTGRLPWLDLTNGQGGKPLVRFREGDILAYEALTRLAPFEGGGRQNGIS